MLVEFKLTVKKNAHAVVFLSVISEYSKLKRSFAREIEIIVDFFSTDRSGSKLVKTR